MRISLITNLNNESLVESCIRELTQARDEGFARLWFTQMPYDVDLLTVLAAALREVPDIDVASGVVPIQNQHPTLLAQRALTLNMIGDGRFTLGIGVTHRAVTEGMWGVSWDKSVKRLSEYLDGLLPLLAKEPVDAPGELVTTRGALQIPHAPTPQVYVAALGPQMLRALPVSVTDDIGAARSLAAQQFAIYGHLPSYRAMLDREGYSGPEDAALIGDESTVSERLDELRDAGVDEFAAISFEPSPGAGVRTRACLRAWESKASSS